MGSVCVGVTAVVGIISDTHGLMRPEALASLAGCGAIIHAGDLGKPEIFERLVRIAPTVAVRGNVDRGAWAGTFPESSTLSLDGVKVYVLHDLKTLAFDPIKRNLDVIVSGHLHQPGIEEKAGVMYLNPGSAGPRRFSLPTTVARLKIGPSGLVAEILDVMTGRLVVTRTVERSRASA